jgi:hypothetical protein
LHEFFHPLKLLAGCLFLGSLNLFFTFAFDLVYRSNINVLVFFPERYLAVDNVKVGQSAACFEVHGKVFLFRPESLRQDSESLFQHSGVILGYHSLAGEFGVFSAGRIMIADYFVVSSLEWCT